METFFNNLIIALDTNDINFIKNNSQMISEMYLSNYTTPGINFFTTAGHPLRSLFDYLTHCLRVNNLKAFIYLVQNKIIDVNHNCEVRSTRLQWQEMMPPGYHLLENYEPTLLSWYLTVYDGSARDRIIINWLIIYTTNLNSLLRNRFAHSKGFNDSTNDENGKFCRNISYFLYTMLNKPTHVTTMAPRLPTAPCYTPHKIITRSLMKKTRSNLIY